MQSDLKLVSCFTFLYTLELNRMKSAARVQILHSKPADTLHTSNLLVLPSQASHFLVQSLLTTDNLK